MKIFLSYAFSVFCLVISLNAHAEPTACESVSGEIIDDLDSMSETAHNLQLLTPVLIQVLSEGSLPPDVLPKLKKTLSESIKGLSYYSNIRAKPISKWMAPGPTIRRIQDLQNNCPKTKTCSMVISAVKSAVGVSWGTLMPLLQGVASTITAFSQNDTEDMKKLANSISKESATNKIYLKQMANNSKQIQSDLQKECFTHQ